MKHALLRVTVLFALSGASTLYAALTSTPINLIGLGSGDGAWFDRELRWTALATVLAICAVYASRNPQGSMRPRQTASRWARLIIVLGLTAMFCAAWFELGLFYAPLVAPAHAFASVRLFDAWQGWRIEIEQRRFS